jgi:hypothetical protein
MYEPVHVRARRYIITLASAGLQAAYNAWRLKPWQPRHRAAGAGAGGDSRGAAGGPEGPLGGGVEGAAMAEEPGEGGARAFAEAGAWDGVGCEGPQLAGGQLRLPGVTVAMCGRAAAPAAGAAATLEGGGRKALQPADGLMAGDGPPAATAAHAVAEEEAEGAGGAAAPAGPAMVLKGAAADKAEGAAAAGEPAVLEGAAAVRAILGDRRATFWSLIAGMPWEVRRSGRAGGWGALCGPGWAWGEWLREPGEGGVEEHPPGGRGALRP